MNILVVCTGNICRSPMGEVVLAQKIADAGITADVDSVGVSSEEHGNPIDRRAASVLRQAGYEVPRRTARQVSAEDLRWADLVLAMTVGHARRLQKLAERQGIDTENLHLWREYDPECELEIAPHGAFGPGGALAQDRGDAGYSDFYSSDGTWDVPDPWYGGTEGFVDTLSVIERGAETIIKQLK